MQAERTRQRARSTGSSGCVLLGLGLGEGCWQWLVSGFRPCTCCVLNRCVSVCAFLGICCMSDKLLCADYCVSWCVSVCLDAHTRPRWSERYSRCWGWGQQGRRRTIVPWLSRSTWLDTTKPASTPTSLSDRPIDTISRIPVGRQVPPSTHTRVRDGPAADVLRADVHTDVDIAVEEVRCIPAGQLEGHGAGQGQG